MIEDTSTYEVILMPAMVKEGSLRSGSFKGGLVESRN